MRLIFLFDITDDKLRRKVNRILEGVGYRIQESVYACDLTVSQMKVLQKDISTHLDDHDRVHYYPLCNKDVRQSKTMGGAECVSIPSFYHI